MHTPTLARTRCIRWGFFIKISKSGLIFELFDKIDFALSLAKTSGIISINWHSRSSLCVSSKPISSGRKKLIWKEEYFTLYSCQLLVLDDVSCHEKAHSLSWFHHSPSKSITNPLFRYMAIAQWDSFFGYNVSNGSPYTSCKNGSGFFSERFKKAFENWIVSLRNV